MAFTDEQKRRLIAAYEPILYFHPDERFVPVDPAVYVQGAALWCTRPADAVSRHNKENWGDCRPRRPAGFPREPLIPRQGISVDPAHDTEGSADPDGDGVNEWYLGHDAAAGAPYLRSSDERMLWLDSAGWQDGEEVTETSENALCNTEGAQARWLEEPLRSASDCYYADAEDIDTLADVVAALQQQGIDVIPVIGDLYGRAWIITYYFLYPIHEEGVLQGLNYEGDWNVISLLIPQPEPLRGMTDPDEMSAVVDNLLDTWERSGDFPGPALVGLGRRARGVPSAGTSFQLMDVMAAENATFVGSHLRTFVARGTHNHYPGTGPQDAPASPEPMCGLDSVEEGDLSDMDVAAIAVTTVGTWLKGIAGGIIGAVVSGPAAVMGALIGFAAGVFLGLAEEVAAIGVAFSDDEETPTPPPPVDYPPDEGHYGLILTPADLVTGFPDEADASEVRPWAGTPEEHAMDRDAQIWWASIPGSPGYDGRWGVMCQNDPCDSRSGMPMPDFRYLFLEEVAIHLSR